MADVLSQSEIDALLNALDTGDIDVYEIKDEEGKKVKDYDFRNPQKISKEQLKTLEVIHENLGRSFQTYLTGHLRTNVKINILTVDQFAYSEFSNAIANPAFLLIIDFSPLQGQILIDISPNLMYIIIDRLLGGSGSDKQELRAFTEIELSLLKNTMAHIVSAIQGAWENIVVLDPRLDKIEINPQFAQVVAPSETIALVTMSIEISGVQGMMNVCIPYLVIEPIMDKLSTRFWFNSATSGKVASDEDKELLRDRILRTKVPIIATLGNTHITINDIANLRYGDVIKLDNKADSEIEIAVGTKIKYFGKVGTSNKQMAVKISKVVKDGELVDEQ